EQTGLEPFAGDVLQRFESGLGGGLVGLVAADQAAEGVAGQRLVGAEVGAGEGGLARAGGPDEHHQGQCRDVQRGAAAALARAVGPAHAAPALLCTLRNRASWVGGPRAASASPTSRCSTV